MSNSIKPEVLGELASIVKVKGWTSLDSTRRRSVLDSFAAMFVDATDDEADVLLGLIREYDIFQDYRRNALELLDGLAAEGVTQAMFGPVRLSSHTKTKSGQHFIYELDSLFTEFPECSFESIDNPLRQKFIFDPRPKILVDDFIGTGDQVLDALTEFEAEDSLLKIERILVIAIQEGARDYIENKLGIRVQCLYERPKGMALVQSGTKRLAEECYALYNSIAARAGTPPEYVLGHRDSEALITLKRTPDNTMGIFWWSNDGKWPAPFPR